ncbi:MAG: hypothetical protein ACRD4H_05805, partial [Candidatus Acidiferrales bacterium]
MAISSHVADTAEDNRTIGTPELRIHIWSLANRIAFRFVFSYLILYIFPFPFGSYPGRVYPFPAYDKMWYAFVPWVGKHILHLRNAITVFPAGSGDTTFNYVQLLCFVVLAAVATIVWTLLDRKRAEYRTLHEWLRIYVRYALAFTMLAYGMDKVIKLQFPDPGLGKLAEPFGNYSPISLLWTFMGYSTAYTHFAGAGEVIGAVLLFFRRTTTLGALILCGVLANVVAMNFCYDVPVKIFSSSLLLMAIFLAAPEAKRLCDMFVLNRPVAAANLDPPLRMRWMRIGRLIVKTIVIIFALCWFTLPYLRVARLRANMPRPPIYGLYQVESFTQNGKPATVSDASWRRVIFEYRGQMSAMAMDDSEQD